MAQRSPSDARRARSARGLALATLLALGAAACSSSNASSPSLAVAARTAAPNATAATHSATPSSSSTADVADPLVRSNAIELQTPDGFKLAGRSFGTGAVGVVLVHYADPLVGQAMWFPFAHLLAGHGYRALTFDLRGYCPGGDGGCSTGTFVKTDTWHDIVMAADFLRSGGASRVFVMGAGLGGHASLWAASRPGVEFAGVISVSSPQLAIGGPASYDLLPAVLRAITEPMLFVAGSTDSAEASQDAKNMFAAANQPKQLVLIRSDAAGPALFAGGTPDEQEQAAKPVLDFIAAHS